MCVSRDEVDSKPVQAKPQGTSREAVVRALPRARRSGLPGRPENPRLGTVPAIRMLLMDRPSLSLLQRLPCAANYERFPARDFSAGRKPDHTVGAFPTASHTASESPRPWDGWPGLATAHQMRRAQP